MNQRQAESDSHGRKTLGRPSVGGSENDQKEHHGHHDFRDQRSEQRVTAG